MCGLPMSKLRFWEKIFNFHAYLSVTLSLENQERFEKFEKMIKRASDVLKTSVGLSKTKSEF